LKVAKFGQDSKRRNVSGYRPSNHLDPIFIQIAQKSGALVDVTNEGGSSPMSRAQVAWAATESSASMIRPSLRAVRRKLGFALYQAQIGQKHESAKMLRGFAETVWQVRADDLGGTYRAVYLAQFGKRFTCFMPSRRRRRREIATPQRELDLIRHRLQLARKLAGK
jgi:phage-related protein